MKAKTKTLHLVLKHKWYDMIASGEKREEYRKKTPYWTRRLWDYATPCRTDGSRDFVTFHRGYTSTTMTFEIESLHWGWGKAEWGAPVCPAEEVFVIKIGERIN